MRVLAVAVAALLLSGCTWIRQELEPTPPLPTPKPEIVVPRKPPPPPPPRPERPAEQVQQSAPMQTIAPPVDNTARCHELAQHRADDAKQLGASQADQTQISNDTFRNCMAPPAKQD